MAYKGDKVLITCAMADGSCLWDLQEEVNEVYCVALEILTYWESVGKCREYGITLHEDCIGMEFPYSLLRTRKLSNHGGLGSDSSKASEPYKWVDQIQVPSNR